MCVYFCCCFVKQIHKVRFFCLSVCFSLARSFLLVLLCVECRKLLWWEMRCELNTWAFCRCCTHYIDVVIIYWCPVWFDCCHYQNHFYFCLSFLLLLLLIRFTLRFTHTCSLALRVYASPFPPIFIFGCSFLLHSCSKRKLTIVIRSALHTYIWARDCM